MKRTLITLVLIIVICAIIPGAIAADDIVKQVSDLTIAVPTPGSAMLGTSGSMSQFVQNLNEAAYNIVALFNQVMGLLGMSNTTATQNIQTALKTGHQLNGGSLSTGTPAPQPGSTPGPNSGTIMIQTTPGGVQVFIDGELRGSTPEDPGKVLVINGISIGSHSLDLRKQGYSSAQETIQVNPGSWAVLVKTLQAAPG